MIVPPTVLVVGAGASKPYGLPLASELLNAARKLGPQQRPGLVYDLLIDGRSGDRVHELLNCLQCIREYSGPSLDSFLENQPKHRELGHSIIAALMGARLQEPGEVLTKEDWLTYLIERMRSGAQTWQQFLKGNHLTFVTFNFDSVIESRLVMAAHQIYRVPEDEAAAALAKAIPVIHLHGTLPPIQRFDGYWLKRASESVKVIHDELDEGVKETAQAALMVATVVCFLGLGYHAENLKTLAARERLANTSRQVDVFGTAVDVLEGEQASVRRRFDRGIVLGGHTQSCVEFLRRNDILKTE